MSFSSEAKSELCALPYGESHCDRAELAGIMYTSGSISIGDGISLTSVSENAAVARRVFTLAKRLYGISCELSIKEHQLKKNNSYQAKLTNAADIMSNLGILFGGYDDETFEQITESTCCKTAFLRGAFLGSGSVSDPKKAYHLELVIGQESFAGPIISVFSSFNITAKKTARKSGHIVYIKDAESIQEFLNIMNAAQAAADMDSIRKSKSTMNNLNRQLNFEGANMSKTLSAADSKIEEIEYIEATIGFAALTPALREAAHLRLEFPHYSIAELAEECGNTTKSGMNHRLRRLHQIAVNLKEKNHEKH